MNWDYILSVTPRFIHATLMTLHLAFWGILLSLVIGVDLCSDYHLQSQIIDLASKRLY